MFRLQIGKSYLWAFLVFLVLFFGGAAACVALGHPGCGFITLPVFIGIIVSSELRSGVALDGQWRAIFTSPSGMYTTMVVWHTIAFFGASVMAAVAAINP